MTNVFSAVSISKGVLSVPITLNGKSFVIERNQSKNSVITKLYMSTHRGMPQSMTIAEGVKTIGELEFIEFMKQSQRDKNIIIVDSRTTGWYKKLRIPGAINIPFTKFSSKSDSLEAMKNYLGVKEKSDGSLDFSKAKTIVVYCNGLWCGQTPAMVKSSKFSLLKMNYPKSKIKYYRGGMQAWTSLGFTVIGNAVK